MNLLAGLILIAVPQAPQPLTLEAALEIASKSSFVVRSAERDFNIAEQNFRQATGQLGPQVSVGGNYTKFDEASGPSSSSEVKEVSATITNIIDITGIASKGVAAARLQRGAARMEYEARKNQVKNDVRESFYAVLQTKSLVKVQQDELASSLERLENARLRQRAGDLSQFDVLRLETEAKRSEKALVEARGNFEIAKQRLNDTLGRSVETDFDPVDVADADDQTMNFESAVKRANEVRPEIAARSLLHRSLRNIRLAHEGAYLPVFSVGATWTRDLDPSVGQNADSSLAFVQFSAPLYTSGVTRARAAAAKAEEEKAKIALDQTRSRVALEVKSAVTLIETSQESLQVALKGLDLAKEAFRLAQLRYNEGEGILLDVTTAQAELTRADAGVVTSRYQLLTAIAALQKAVGTDDIFQDHTTTRTTKQ